MSAKAIIPYRQQTLEEGDGRDLLTSKDAAVLFPREATFLRQVSDSLTVVQDDQRRRLHFTTIYNAACVYSLALVGQGGKTRVYTRKFNSDTPVFHPLHEDIDVQALLSAHAPLPITGSEARDIHATLMVELTKSRHKYVHLPRRIIAISSQLYWDQEAATLYPAYPPNKDKHGPVPPCFIRLFDSDGGKSKVPTFTRKEIDKAFGSSAFMDTYKEVLDALEDLPNHEFPKDDAPSLPRSKHLTFIEEWADGHPGLYWDLIKIVATIFMGQKPDAAYFLTGTGANGKSAFVNLIKTLLGTANTSGVQISKVGDWHFSSRLQYILLNAPDDEGEDITKYATEFKSISAHEMFEIPIMRSQSSAILNPDFMCIFPMNQKPDWKAKADTSALTRRTLDFPFTGTFNTPEYKNKYHDFAKECYTLPALRDLLAYALAIATFYTNHKQAITWSETIDESTRKVVEQNNNVKIYQEAFNRFFDGFQTIRMLYNDYTFFCDANEYTPMPFNAFREHWEKWEQKGNESLLKFQDANKAICRARCHFINKRPGYYRMVGRYPLSAMGLSDRQMDGAQCIDQLHDKKISIVQILTAMTEMMEGKIKEETDE